MINATCHLCTCLLLCKVFSKWLDWLQNLMIYFGDYFEDALQQIYVATWLLKTKENIWNPWFNFIDFEEVFQSFVVSLKVKKSKLAHNFQYFMIKPKNKETNVLHLKIPFLYIMYWIVYFFDTVEMLNGKHVAFIYLFHLD